MYLPKTPMEHLATKDTVIFLSAELKEEWIVNLQQDANVVVRCVC